MHAFNIMPLYGGIIMFDKLKKFMENLAKGYEYVCDVETILTYMQKEIVFSIE